MRGHQASGEVAPHFILLRSPEGGSNSYLQIHDSVVLPLNYRGLARHEDGRVSEKAKGLTNKCQTL